MVGKSLGLVESHGCQHDPKIGPNHWFLVAADMFDERDSADDKFIRVISKQFIVSADLAVVCFKQLYHLIGCYAGVILDDSRQDVFFILWTRLCHLLLEQSFE